MKIKNVPKSLKCKINTNFFLDKGFPKGGVGGGGADVWEKFPNNIVFFLRAYLSLLRAPSVLVKVPYVKSRTSNLENAPKHYLHLLSNIARGVHCFRLRMRQSLCFSDIFYGNQQGHCL